MTWCRQYGTGCKAKNCAHEHLKDFPGVCDASLYSEEHFVMCELEPKHKGSHRGLNMVWDGKGRTKADRGEWLRANVLMKAHINRISERDM